MMVAPCFWRQLDEPRSTETETLTMVRDKTNERPTFTCGSEWMAACLTDGLAGWSSRAQPHIGIFVFSPLKANLAPFKTTFMN